MSTRGTLSEPIAIVGIGCRFPGGATDAASFSEFLLTSKDAITEVPANRWSLKDHYDPRPDQPGKTYVKEAGFLSGWDPTSWDGNAFNITSREAATLDPQQRLMLEITSEAIDDAGMRIEDLAGSETGVFLGCFTLDGMITQMSPYNRRLINPHTATSSTMAILANRISYMFDLKGPSFSLDTACSSSLVALNSAVQAIDRGECDMALAGGVNVMLRPEYPMIMGSGHFLAPDGRCKSFDARANGYGRGEGAGLMVLKPLSVALRDNDQIYALIKGSGVNQDGRTNGIALPNGTAQAKLIRHVMTQTETDPADIAYVEAHGTGTAAGDPIECHALGETVGAIAGRSDACVIGSVKSSIGHLEAAAGAAGLIKAIMVLKQGKAPGQANLEELNPDIPFDDLGLKVAREETPLRAGPGGMHASVNSFGYGGTNGHVLLQQYVPVAPSSVPVAAKRPDIAKRALLLPLSARSPEALEITTAAMADQIEAAPDSIDDICFTAARRRSNHDHRLVARADTAIDLVTSLRSHANGQATEAVIADRATAAEAKGPVFVFTGMGPQWWGMGRDLLVSEPVFAEAAKACDTAFQAHSGWSILAEMARDEASSQMADTRIAQPANALIQVALTDLLRSWGITPQAVVGHSVGEVGAAYAGGCLTRAQAMHVAYVRSQTQSRVAGQGTMLAVGVTLDVAEALATTYEGVSIAAINGPTSITLAGAKDALQPVADLLEQQGDFNRFLRVEIAYHSAQMTPLQADIEAMLADLAPAASDVPLYSTVTGAQETAPLHDAAYWYRNVRQPVLFAKAIAALVNDGCRSFLEIGPHPVLSAAIKECVLASGGRAEVFASLRRAEPELPQLLDMVARLHCHGLSPDWATLVPDANLVDLPAYPWQREILWQESTAGRIDRIGSDAHPLLGNPSDGPSLGWTTTITPMRQPWIDDHIVQGSVVFPGAGYAEIGLALQALQDRNAGAMIEHLSFEKGLVVSEGAEPGLFTQLDADGRNFTVSSRDLNSETAAWQLHMRGRLSQGRAVPAATIDVAEVAARLPDQLDGNGLYDKLAEAGLTYGPCFQTIRSVRHSKTEALAELHLPDAATDDAYILHPALLDGCFQALVALMPDELARGTVFVPVAIRSLRLHQAAPQDVLCHIVNVRREGRTLLGDLTLLDRQGVVLADVKGLVCSALTRVASTDDELASWHYAQTAIPAAVSPADAGNAQPLTGSWAIVGANTTTGPIAAALESRGAACHQITDVAGLKSQPDVTGIVLATALDADRDDAGESLAIDVLTCSHSIDDALPQARDLIVLTSGAFGPSGASTPAHAAGLGLTRVVAAERPHLRVRTIDLTGADANQKAQTLADEIALNSDETEVALTDQGRFVMRIEREDIMGTETSDAEVDMVRAGSVPMSLEIGQIGRIESLQWRQTAPQDPAEGEIEIDVQAVSVNFKDVLKTLGMLDPEALQGTFHGAGLGMEVCGTVKRIGPGVTEVAVGDAITAQPKHGFRNPAIAVVSDMYWRHSLPGVSPEKCVGLPIVFITAYHGLHECAQLQAGESVLIHAAAGGVGQAAIQVAKWSGAIIHATAGSDEKRARLKQQGCDFVYDSRSLDFSEEILANTDGNGVDVVLNSLAGEAAAKSLDLLAPWGRFIEIGKRDFVEGGRMDMAAFNRAITYFAVDLDRMMGERPLKFDRIYGKIWDLFKEGVFTAPDTTVFDCHDVSDAFRMLAQSKNVGKVVVSMRSKPLVPVVRAAKAAPALFDPAARYLVTGGLSGFGLATAKWMADQGAVHLILAGRRGADTPGATMALEALRAKGAAPTALTLDVADGAAVTAAIAQIENLKGVFHAAGVLNDGLLEEQTAERIASVMRPKALGASHLHQATQTLPLDHFVLFSSVSSLIGNAGQAGYVAANAYLDALAGYRQAQGLAGVSINWGAIGQVGMAARDAQVGDHLARMGINPLAPDAALDALKRVLTAGGAQHAIMDVNWATWSQLQPGVAAQPRFVDVIAEIGQAGENEVVTALQALDPGERLEMLTLMLAEVVAETLRISAEQIDTVQPLTDMGLDSLMTVELQTGIATRFGVEISAMELMKGIGLGDLGQMLLTRLGVGDKSNVDTTVPAEAKAIDDMDDAEIDAMLSQLQQPAE